MSHAALSLQGGESCSFGDRRGLGKTERALAENLRTGVLSRLASEVANAGFIYSMKQIVRRASRNGGCSEKDNVESSAPSSSSSSQAALPTRWRFFVQLLMPKVIVPAPAASSCFFAIIGAVVFLPLLVVVVPWWSSRLIPFDRTAAVWAEGESSQQQPSLSQHRRLLEEQLQQDDGNDNGSSFLGHALTYHPPAPPTSLSDASAFFSVASTVHCVGENYGVDAWMYRSCQFRNLCFDSDTHEFLLFPATEERALLEQLERLQQQLSAAGAVRADWFTVSSVGRSRHQDLSLGTVQDPWDDTVAANVKWFPKVITDPIQQTEMLANGYYQLPSDVLLFPWQPSMTETLLWQDFYAIYTVLSMFGLEGKELALFPLSLANDDDIDPAVDATLAKLGPALGVSGGDGTRTKDQLFKFSSNLNAKKSNIVCARYGTAGLGMIAKTRERTDRSSNQEQILTHAVGRGALYRGFRSFLMNKLGLPNVQKASAGDKIVSIASGDVSIRDRVGAALRRLFPDDKFRVQSLDTNTLSIQEQAQAAATSQIYVADLASPSSVLIAATFLPQGSVFVVQDKDTEGRASEKRQVRDVLEVMGHFRLHWLQSLDDVAGMLQEERVTLGVR